MTRPQYAENMQIAQKLRLARKVRGIAMLASAVLRTAQAAPDMPSAQVNAVVQKYCGGCHNDATMAGSMTLQRFDAANADPTLAAMLLNKITNGRTPADVAKADAKGILNLTKASAMGASGSVPDEPTQVTFAQALAKLSNGAYAWNVRSDNGALSASLLKESYNTKWQVTDSYRLIVSCQAAARAGEIKIAWANSVPTEGQVMAVTVDGGAPLEHKAEGGREQGNGNNGPGATVLKIPLPARSLVISNVLGAGNIEFSFGGLNEKVRRELSVCFGAK